MRTLTDNTIDDLIRRVKSHDGISDFVFSSGYPAGESSCTGSKYVVSVENRGVKVKDFFIGGAVGEGKKGAVFEALLRLRVYAPRCTNGSALLRASSLLADAVDAADTGGLTRSVELSGIDHDRNLKTIYRDLTIRMEQVLYEEVCHD